MRNLTSNWKALLLASIDRQQCTRLLGLRRPFKVSPVFAREHRHAGTNILFVSECAARKRWDILVLFGTVDRVGQDMLGR